MAGRQQTAPPQQRRSKDETAHPHHPGALPVPPHPDRPRVTTPLLIPPFNQLAQLPTARAHGENAQEGRGLRMPDQRRITREIMHGWAPHNNARENGAPQPLVMS
jgi:hypothetical protein